MNAFNREFLETFRSTLRPRADHFQGTSEIAALLMRLLQAKLEAQFPEVRRRHDRRRKVAALRALGATHE